MDVSNRLAKVTPRHDAFTLAEYNYDGTDRRIKKVVSHSGDRDGIEYDYCSGQKIIKIRNSSWHGTAQRPARNARTAQTASAIR